eukprot:3829715-Heterocapsa_arctica.AAC.1
MDRRYNRKMEGQFSLFTNCLLPLHFNIQQRKRDLQSRSTHGQSHPDCQHPHFDGKLYIGRKETQRGMKKRNDKDMSIAKNKNKIKANCRIGEASIPGPGDQNKQKTQRKLGDLFHKMHTTKDDKAEWCKER